MPTYQIVIDAASHGERLDVAINKSIPELSRRKARALIDLGAVYLAGKRVRLASKPVQAGDKLVVEYHEEVLRQHRRGADSLKSEQILAISDEFVVINKPPGMPAQATRNQSVFHVATAIKGYFLEQGIRAQKLELVHRLDKETSGAMIVARSAANAAWLSDQFKARNTKKVYWALCHGRVGNKTFEERARLAPIDRTGTVLPSANGKEALTRFRVLRYNDSAKVAWLECQPETGRSHQIRVHLQINGLPILGDKRYSKALLKLPPDVQEAVAMHHMLHARSLTIRPSPDLLEATFTASVPETFARLATFFFPDCRFLKNFSDIVP